MKRDIYTQLSEWKSSPRRKPLLMRGARQTGKTYILQEFGQKEYARLHYFNFEEDTPLGRFFERDLAPKRLLADLGVYRNQPIEPSTDLLFFDEIQVSNRALNALKYFQEQMPEAHVVAAGSLLGTKLSTPGSFPVGKVNFLELYPLSFLEFLDALGESRYRQLLESQPLTPLQAPFHEDLIRLLGIYYAVGGMPEAVRQYALNKNLKEVREIQNEILTSYTLDFAKHAPAPDIPKLSVIWNSIPAHLSRENKRFVFSAIRSGARAREYEHALSWLQDAGLTYCARAVESSRLPLKHHADGASFKIYALDVGLLGALTKAPMEMTAARQPLFYEYHGAFVENYAAQQWVATQPAGSHAVHPELYYWRNRSGQAEVDFLCELRESVFPLEIKAGLNTKSKSLRVYEERFNPAVLLRGNLLNLKKDGKILNVPLYMLSQIPRLLNHVA
jgi:uncharacterized protein